VRSDQFAPRDAGETGAHLGESEGGVFGHQREVAHDREAETEAEGVALDLGDADQWRGPQSGFEFDEACRFTTDCRGGTARALASRTENVAACPNGKTRARGFDDSARSAASMASNIPPVTSLPWLELSKVKVRMPAARSITTRLPAVGLVASLGFLLLMTGTVHKEFKPVKWRGTCPYRVTGQFNRIHGEGERTVRSAR